MMPDPYKPPSSLIEAEATRPPALPLLWNPLLWLGVLAAVYCIEAAYLRYVGEELSGDTHQLWAIVFALLLAYWVHADRRNCGYAAPFEFDAFVVFLWPIVAPYYLYRTRGWYGLLTGTGVWLLFLAPALVWGIVDAVVSE